MSGKLYLVGTPIGNLGDISPRAVDTLASADFIAAEDTRVTLRLLNHLGIKKPLVSYHEHNKESMGEAIVSRLLAGENCALCTDAGMPCISDPGQELVSLCAQSGVEVVAIPGPSALVTGLALSGISGGRFVFEGFISVKKGSRQKHLAMLKAEERTMIFYEAPHKLPATLEDMLSALGDRKIALCREITKLHEETIHTTLSEAVSYYSDHSPRGEYVLVIEGAAPASAEQTISEEEAAALVKQLQAKGLSLSQAAKDVSALTGHKKARLYTLALK